MELSQDYDSISGIYTPEAIRRSEADKQMNHCADSTVRTVKRKALAAKEGLCLMFRLM